MGTHYLWIAILKAPDCLFKNHTILVSFEELTILGFFSIKGLFSPENRYATAKARCVLHYWKTFLSSGFANALNDLARRGQNAAFPGLVNTFAPKSHKKSDSLIRSRYE